MIDKKNTGSFYTPKIIANFLVDYLFEKIKDKNLSVLEPSVGDGIFVNSLVAHSLFFKRINEIVAVEKDESELSKIDTRIKGFQPIANDFLEFQKDNNSQFSLVLGNPPYYKSKQLTKKQKELSKEIYANAGLSFTSAKNIWATFFVRCISFTNKTGVMALILPSDLKQVSFAKELKELLFKEFERIEIFNFKELLFKDCKGQDTLILIAERKSNAKGVFTCDIQSSDELTGRSFVFKEEIRIASTKWNHEHLSSEEFSFIENIKSNLKPISHYTTSKPGVVTGANKYFIVDEKTLKNYKLNKFAKPIIQKGIYVNGSLSFKEEDLEKLTKAGKPTHLIHIDSSNDKLLSEINNQYLSLDGTMELQERYKLKIREVWYRIPNVSKPSEALFFKRSHNYPKLLKNEAKILATDAAYYIDPKEGFEINDLIYSFYNSFTLALAELTGRYYGGGVLELVPSEFKSLPIPYAKINEAEFRNYNIEFENKEGIDEILLNHDSQILHGVLNMNLDEILKIQGIRKKLVSKRFREI